MSIIQKEMLTEIGVYEAPTYHASGHHHFAQVGKDFAGQYYISLCLNPQNTCKFYKEESIMSRPGNHGMRSVTTLKEIKNEILHSDMTNSTIILLAVHSQETIAESIIVGVTGLLSKDGKSNRFHQNFLLAPQVSELFVKNDFLRFIDLNNSPDIAEYKTVSVNDVDVNHNSATIAPAIIEPSTSTRIVKTILVRNLPPEVTRRSITNALKPFGPVSYNNIQIRGYNDGYSYAFVEFNNPRSAKRAIRAKSILIDGQECLVEHKQAHIEELP